MYSNEDFEIALSKGKPSLLGLYISPGDSNYLSLYHNIINT